MIQTKPISKITWSDIEALVADRTPEGPQLEFKSGKLLLPDAGQSELSKKKRQEARDDFAKEIAALANAYGGMIVVAIDDKIGDVQHHAAVDITPVPNVADEKRRLEDAIISIMDPPIAGLEFGIVLTAPEQTDGAIIVRVPTSLAAPHGFGEPPSAYVRRGDRSMPMTMRDLQSVFWDARTRRERVKELRAEEQQLLDQRAVEWDERRFIPEGGQAGVLFRLSAIAHERLNFRSIPAHRIVDLRPSVDVGCLNGDDGQFVPRLCPIANGLRNGDGSPAQWRLTHDGVISVVGFDAAWSVSVLPEDNKGVQPFRYAGTALQILIMMERLRRALGYPGLPFEFDCELRARKTVRVLSYDCRHVLENSNLPPISRIGPFAVGAAADIEPVFQEIRLSVFNAFGVEQSPHPTGNVKIADVIAQRWP